MTEESQQPVTTVTTPVANPLTPDNHSTDVIKPKSDNKKEKCKPMTKVVIRRLPPSMNQVQFIEQVSPLPDHDYLHFVKADMSLGQHAFCRAYINFMDQKDIFIFREKFDNYVFVDAKGTEYPAVVEFAPFQRLPKKRVGRKKDIKCGTIETDPYYVGFLESLKNLEAEAAVAQPKTEFSFQPFDNAQKRVTTTPLLEYLKLRKIEKQRVRDEKREERRRRDLEKRRAKDEPTISKVLKNPDTEREVGRDNKENKEEKEKFPRDTKNRKKDEKSRDNKAQGPRDRDGKMSAKGYKDERKQDGKHQKKHEDKKSYNRRDDRDNHQKEEKKIDSKSPKEPKEDVRERRIEEKKGKSYEKMRQEKRRLAESKKQAEGSAEGAKEDGKREEGERRKKEAKIERIEGVSSCSEVGGGDCADHKVQSKEKNHKNAVVTECKGEGDSVKTPEPIKSNKESRSFDMDDSDHCPTTKKSVKLVRRRSSLESGADAGGGDAAQLRRHKSLDGDDQSNLQKNTSHEKHKEKKDARKERRIRNKDRPAMEIYRPGMGRFSKQRIERGKSTDERASLSESPTNTTDQKLEKSELRSMTFKRSVSRDNP